MYVVEFQILQSLAQSLADIVGVMVRIVQFGRNEQVFALDDSILSYLYVCNATRTSKRIDYIVTL